MFGTSVHAACMAKPASQKAVRSAALIGALLLTATVINVLIAVADIRTRAAPLAGAGSAAVCQAGDHAHLAQHPFRGALAPYAMCAAPHG